MACSVVKPAFPVMTSRGRLLVVRLTEKDSFHDLKQKLTECEPRVQQPLVSHSDPTLASNFYIQSLGRREPKKPENKMKCASLFG